MKWTLLIALCLLPGIFVGQESKTGWVFMHDPSGEKFRVQIDGKYLDLEADTARVLGDIPASRHIFTAFYEQGKANEVIHVKPGEYYVIVLKGSMENRRAFAREVNKSEFYRICRCEEKIKPE